LDGLKLIERRGARQPYTATQTGTAIIKAGGIFPIPAPLFGEAALTSRPVTVTPLEIIYQRARAWQYNWSYSFSSANPLTGQPGIR
jgi:hypothetical protein